MIIDCRYQEGAFLLRFDDTKFYRHCVLFDYGHEELIFYLNFSRASRMWARYYCIYYALMTLCSLVLGHHQIVWISIRLWLHIILHKSNANFFCFYFALLFLILYFIFLISARRLRRLHTSASLPAILYSYFPCRRNFMLKSTTIPNTAMYPLVSPLLWPKSSHLPMTLY